MEPAASPDLPLACDPAAIPAAERPAHLALARHLFTEAAQERRDLPDGLAFRLPAEAWEPAALFVANERRCCPFLRFELSAAPAAGPVRLRITGPAGTRDFLRAELRL
ncbi:MAG TPA: hypothetical protein VF615_26970 [Longimicrobiaceae bacterium]|jgi:hypothetical protein